jgi:hypothetical protein
LRAYQVNDHWENHEVEEKYRKESTTGEKVDTDMRGATEERKNGGGLS